MVSEPSPKSRSWIHQCNLWIYFSMGVFTNSVWIGMIYFFHWAKPPWYCFTMLYSYICHGFPKKKERMQLYPDFLHVTSNIYYTRVLTTRFKRDSGPINPQVYINWCIKCTNCSLISADFTTHGHVFIIFLTWGSYTRYTIKSIRPPKKASHEKFMENWWNFL